MAEEKEKGKKIMFLTALDTLTMAQPRDYKVSTDKEELQPSGLLPGEDNRK